MNELAVQASNGTNSESDRSSIQDEINQLTTEIDRVAETTKFNETYLLKGDYGTKTIQIKAHDAGLDGTLTQNTTKATFTITALAQGDTVTIGGTKYTIGVNGADTTAMLTNAKTVLGAGTAINPSAGEVLKIDGKSFTITNDTTNVNTSELNMNDLGKFAGLGSTIEYNGKSVTLFNEKNVTGAHVDSKVSTVITQEQAYNLMANELRAASSIGADSVIGAITPKDGNGAALVSNTINGYTTQNAANKITFTMTKGTAEVQKDLTFNLHVGSDADMTNKIGVTISDMSAASLGVQGLNVSDATGKAATYAIDAIADAVEKVSAQRSSLGAIQNRLEHTIANVDNVVENTNAAESRIRDTDMADEMVTYSKNNILAQAGQAMLAQANQATQGVLSILG